MEILSPQIAFIRFQEFLVKIVFFDKGAAGVGFDDSLLLQAAIVASAAKAINISFFIFVCLVCLARESSIYKISGNSRMIVVLFILRCLILLLFFLML
jgi:hypothetical protein